MVIATDVKPSHWAFYFQGSGLPQSVSGSWSHPCIGLILPYRNFRKLAWCCIEWLFSYLARWLPCIWIRALQKLVCVIKVVQYFLFFPDWPIGYWVWLTSTVLLLFQHRFLPISIWKLIICHGNGCFWSGIFFLTLPKQLFNFGVCQRWICWHHPIPLNLSIITHWSLYYLWGPWGWMHSNILKCIR